MPSATGFSASPVHRQPRLDCLAIIIYVNLMDPIYTIWYYHFSAFWLRSSVISLLISLIYVMQVLFLQRTLPTAGWVTALKDEATVPRCSIQGRINSKLTLHNVSRL